MGLGAPWLPMHGTAGAIGAFPGHWAVAGNSRPCSTTDASVLPQAETAESGRSAKPCLFPLAIRCLIRIKPNLLP